MPVDVTRTASMLFALVGIRNAGKKCCAITRNVSILSAHISDMVETNLQQYDAL